MTVRAPKGNGVYTVSMAADYLGVSISTLSRMMASGTIRSARTGRTKGRVFISQKALDDFVDGQMNLLRAEWIENHFEL